MKQTFLMLIASLVVSTGFTQNEKYVKAMEEKVPAIDTTRSMDGLKDLANAFERIADAEKNQWLPFYYAALANINIGYVISTANGGMTGGNADKIDPLADKADELIKKAEEISKDNSEIYAVKKMNATLRLMADPMNRYMEYGPLAAEALETAKKLNPENPRVYLLEAEDKYFTPEQYGGSKSEAKKLFEVAVAKYESFKPESSIHPSWGLGTTKYFLSQIQ